MVRITSQKSDKKETTKIWKRKGQSDIIKNSVGDLITKMHIPALSKEIERKIQESISKNHKVFLIGFLSV